MILLFYNDLWFTENNFNLIDTSCKTISFHMIVLSIYVLHIYNLIF